MTGTFAQHHVESLDLDATCVDCVQASFPGITDLEARNILGRFGISGQALRGWLDVNLVNRLFFFGGVI